VQTLQLAEFLHLASQHVMILLLRFEQMSHRGRFIAETHFLTGPNPKVFGIDAFAHAVVSFIAA
jgi:hypothetical protein